MNFEQLKYECWQANMSLPEQKLVFFTFGNVSCIDREHGVFAIKPSGVEYDKLTPEDMVIVDIATGETVSGSLRPSSDTNTHLELYRKWTQIGGIVHTHSTYAAAWAQAARPVPILGTTHADHLPVEVPCTEFMPNDRIENDYETETGLQIINCFERQHLLPADVPMVLVAGHGPFTWGESGTPAVYNAKVLEELCKMALFTLQIDPATTQLKKSLIDKHYRRKHGKDAYYGQQHV